LAIVSHAENAESRGQTEDRRQYAVGRRQEKVKRSKLKVMKIEGVRY
jgi:hypothetical protein